MLIEAGGSAAASLAVVWVAFALAGISAPFGMGVSWFLAFFATYGILCWRLYGVLIAKDRLATVGIWAGALVAMFALGAVIFYVLFKGFSAVFDDFPHFLTADMTQLGGEAKITQLGVGAAIVGTVEQVGIATVLTVPLGIMTATYLVGSNGPFSRLVGAVVDAMTGAPAIIAGLFVYLLWVVPHHENGKSGLAAALALAVMMLPIVTRAAQEVVAIVPGSLREAALALGAPEWRVLLRVVLPTARAGLMTAVILGIARIAGETAPVLFNAGGLEAYNWNPFSGQQDNLPLRIYENIFQPGRAITQSAWGASLVLVLVVLILFLVARFLGKATPGRRRFSPWSRFRKPSAEVTP
jgi:phosphate transport system permease protein